MEKIEGLDVHQFIFTDLPNGSGSYQADKTLYPYVKINGEYYVNDGTSFTYTTAALLMPITYGYQIQGDDNWSGLALFEHDEKNNKYFESKERVNYTSRIDNAIHAVKLDLNNGGYKINYGTNKDYSTNEEYVWAYANSDKTDAVDLYNFKDPKEYGFSNRIKYTNLNKFGTSKPGAIIPFWTNEETGYEISVQIKGNKLTAISNDGKRTMYLPYGSKVLLFLREGGDMKLTKTLPVRTGNIFYNSVDQYVDNYYNYEYKGLKTLTPQILLISHYSGYGSAVITNLSTRTYSSAPTGGISGLGPQSLAEVEISGVKMYTTQITISKDTSVSFTLDGNFTNLVKWLWHPVLYNNNLVKSNNAEYKCYLNTTTDYEKVGTARAWLLNEEKDYQIQNYVNIKYTSVPSLNIFETKMLGSDSSSSYNVVTGRVENGNNNYDIYAKFNLNIIERLYGIVGNKTAKLIDPEAIKPYTFKLDGVQYTADTNTFDLDNNLTGNLAAFSANLTTNSPGSYASWIAIAPPEWSETIEGKLLNINQSTVNLGVWIDQDLDEFGNIHYVLTGTQKNTNNFDVCATINYQLDGKDLQFSTTIKANTTEHQFFIEYCDDGTLKEMSTTFKAIGYNVLEKHNVTSADFGADLYAENGNLYIGINNRTGYSGTALVSYTVNGATKSRTLNIAPGYKTFRLTTLSVGSNRVILKDVVYTINGKSISVSYNTPYSFTVSGPVTDPEM